jgi:rhodanese-related sulfurtransferase
MVNTVEITAEELRQRLQEKPIVLLDVRETEERAGGYIPGSVHIPMNWVPFRLNTLDKTQEIVVYCAHGVRSQGVADFLRHQGYQATSLRGGIYSWLAVQGMIKTG